MKKQFGRPKILKSSIDVHFTGDKELMNEFAKLVKNINIWGGNVSKSKAYRIAVNDFIIKYKNNFKEIVDNSK